MIQETQRMLTSLLGHAPREIHDWEEIARTLTAGPRDIILELPWQHPDEEPSRHEIVVKRRDGDRVIFFNPRSHGELPVGAVLPATSLVPERRVEGEGLESLPEASLQQLFAQGGMGLNATAH